MASNSRKGLWRDDKGHPEASPGISEMEALILSQMVRRPERQRSRAHRSPVSVPASPSPTGTAHTAPSGANYICNCFQLQLIPLSPSSNNHFRLPSSSASSSSGLDCLPHGVLQILIRCPCHALSFSELK